MIRIGQLEVKGNGFNAGICAHEGRILVVYRYDRKTDAGFRSTARLGFLKDNSLEVIEDREIIDLAEDPRLFKHDGSVWVAYTHSPEPGGAWDRNSMRYCRLTDDFKVASKHQIDYAHFPGLHYGPQMEKNWQFFSHEGKLYTVYSINPHILLQLCPPKEDVVVLRSSEGLTWHWDWGAPRGGTPPVRIGDEYFTFYHHWIRKSILPSGEQLPHVTRFYYTRAYAFEAKPPFRITRKSRTPLIAPQRVGRLIIFAAGAIYTDGQWLLSCGVNDDKSELWVIDHDEVLADMEDV